MTRKPKPKPKCVAKQFELGPSQAELVRWKLNEDQWREPLLTAIEMIKQD